MCEEWFQVTVNSPASQSLLQWRLGSSFHVAVPQNPPKHCCRQSEPRLSLWSAPSTSFPSFWLQLCMSPCFLGVFLSVTGALNGLTMEENVKKLRRVSSFLFPPKRCLCVFAAGWWRWWWSRPPCSSSISCWPTCWVCREVEPGKKSFPLKVKVQHLTWSVLTSCFIYCTVLQLTHSSLSSKIGFTWKQTDVKLIRFKSSPNLTHTSIHSTQCYHS